MRRLFCREVPERLSVQPFLKDRIIKRNDDKVFTAMDFCKQFFEIEGDAFLVKNA